MTKCGMTRPANTILTYSFTCHLQGELEIFTAVDQPRQGLHTLKGLSTQRDFAQRFSLQRQKVEHILHPHPASLQDPHQQGTQIFEHCPNSHEVSNASVLRSRCLRPRVHFPQKVEENPAWIIAIISQLSISCLFILNPRHVLHNWFHDIISLTD